MAQQRFYRCTSLREALQMIADYKNDAVVVAGGTDVLPALRAGQYTDRHLFLDISAIDELTSIESDTRQVLIGALATHTKILNNPLVWRDAPVLAQACRHIGSPPIRNRATIGGNIITLAACADTVPALLVLSAQLEFAALHGRRLVDIEAYLEQREQRIDSARELLVAIHLPCFDTQQWRYAFEKVARRHAGAKARMSVAVMTKVEQGLFVDTRIAVGAVAPWPHRMRKAEDAMNGRKPEEVDAKQIGVLVAEATESMTERRRSFSYKLPVLEEVLQRCLEKICAEEQHV